MSSVLLREECRGRMPGLIPVADLVTDLVGVHRWIILPPFVSVPMYNLVMWPCAQRSSHKLPCLMTIWSVKVFCCLRTEGCFEWGMFHKGPWSIDVCPLTCWEDLDFCMCSYFHLLVKFWALKERHLLGPMWLIRSGQQAHSSDTSLWGDCMSLPFLSAFKEVYVFFWFCPWLLFFLYFSSFFQAFFLSPWQGLLHVAPFTVELGKEPKMFLLCKALKARVGERYYYGCCFLF